MRIFPIIVSTICRFGIRSFNRDSVMMSTKKPIVSIPGAIRNTSQIDSLYTPQGTKQTEYVKLLDHSGLNILISIGPVGTGKTLFAIVSAIKELQKGTIKKIVFTLPFINGMTNDFVSYIPANMRIQPYFRSIFDVLDEYYSRHEINKMLYECVIEIIPLQFITKRTFIRSFVIADEMQHLSIDQMATLTNCLGKGSRMVITGDITHCSEENNRGLVDIVNKIEKNISNKPSDMIRLIKMGHGDVKRSLVVSNVMALYDKQNTDDSTPLTHGEFSVFSLKK